MRQARNADEQTKHLIARILMCILYRTVGTAEGSILYGRIEKTSDFTQDRLQDPAPRKFGTKAPKKVKTGPVGRGDDGRGWTRVPNFLTP